MDGFPTDMNIVVLAATNMLGMVDAALLRPGRFDRKIYFHLPDVKGRVDILKIHARKKPLAEDVDLREIAKLTPGFSGADLENLLNEAAIKAGRENKETINREDIKASREKVILGKEQRSWVMNEEEKRVIAHHEAGHALLAAVLEHCDPPDKVTIIPRDLALGATSLTIEDRHNMTREFLEDQITMLLGGQAAETIVCGTQTAGAQNDLEKATKMATAMVCEYGMSEDLGPLHVHLRSESLSFCSLMPEEVRMEIRALLKRLQGVARKRLEEHFEELQNIAKLLLEKETITGEEILKLLKSVSPNKSRQ